MGNGRSFPPVDGAIILHNHDIANHNSSQLSSFGKRNSVGAKENT